MVEPLQRLHAVNAYLGTHMTKAQIAQMPDDEVEVIIGLYDLDRQAAAVPAAPKGRRRK
jgi:hypothetical protein